MDVLFILNHLDSLHHRFTDMYIELAIKTNNNTKYTNATL